MTSDDIKAQLNAVPQAEWPALLRELSRQVRAENVLLNSDLARARTNLALVQLHELEKSIGTQGDVADKIGVTSGYLTHVRKGRRLVSAGMAKRINDLLRTMRDA